MRVVAIASPNYGVRPKGVRVDTVVIHADAAADAQASISWIRSPQSKVSYHSLVDRDGTVYRFVEPSRRAWHAGVSTFDGRDNVNQFSLGLAFANRNDGKELYVDAQYVSGAAVVAGWMELYPAITLDRLTTHAVIREAWRAKGHPEAEVKHDPGPLFDMDRLKALIRTLQTEVPTPTESRAL